MLTCVTAHVPSSENPNVTAITSLISRHSTSPAFAYRVTASSVPHTLCILFVPSANCGGNPTASNAGTEINPPPPAIESMNPAASPAKNSSR